MFVPLPCRQKFPTMVRFVLSAVKHRKKLETNLKHKYNFEL